MALNEIKGRVEHKAMIASGAITGPERPKTDWSVALLAGLMLALMFVACLAVMVTAPFWMNPI